MELLTTQLSFGGEQRRYRHQSQVLGCDMHFSLYLPPRSQEGTPVVLWLSGLTCTDENFVLKAGAQRWASELGLVILCPDTSPRGPGVPDSSEDYLGHGASFYFDAKQEPWRKHFQMESYVCQELIALVRTMGLQGPMSIAGHSMGGHGALTLALRHPDLFKAVSAFAPVCDLVGCDWGMQALTAYLGEESRSTWVQHQAVTLLAAAKPPWPLRVDVGLHDDQWHHLSVMSLVDAARQSGALLDLRVHGGYDHSYFFVASFIGEHLRHHARAFGLPG